MNPTNKHILLTGGTGLIGTNLTNHLLQKGYHVSHLSRSPGKNERVKTYFWDVEQGMIDENCLDDVDVIIHLAGAGIADKRWTDERKKEIIDSRTKSIGLIYQLLGSVQHHVNTVVSASAIGYYGNRGDELMVETSPPNNDFLARCCVEWEEAVDKGQELGLRIIKFRTGVVLDKGGALAMMALPVKLFVGSPLGSGKQWVPWIHWLDVINMYIYSVENVQLRGAYNMVAPNAVTNKQLTGAIAKQLHKPLWAPNVPAFLIKLLMGERGAIALGSTRVLASKIEKAGFIFTFTEVADALKDIYD